MSEPTLAEAGNSYSQAVWDLPMTATQKFVLLALAYYADEEGMCDLTIEALEMRTFLSKRAIESALHWLEEEGYLITERRHGQQPYCLLTL